MPKHTQSTPNTGPDQPLSLIYIPGWKFDPSNGHGELAEIWQSTLDKLEEIDPQQALLSSAEALIIDFASSAKAKPKDVMQELELMIVAQRQKGHHVGLIGHAIGGYYAAYMAEKYQLPAILINPLVKAYQSLLLADLLEDSPSLEFIQTQLKELEVTPTRPDSLMLMLQKGDLLQDYQQALDKYRHCNQIILNGGNHQFQNLQLWLGAMIGFFKRYYHCSN